MTSFSEHLENLTFTEKNLAHCFSMKQQLLSFFKFNF